MRVLVFALLIFCADFVAGQGVTTFAGTGSAAGPIADGGPAVSAYIGSPGGGAFDRNGNYYFGANGNRIRKIDTHLTITTYAGNGATGYSGDGGPATAAELHGPTHLHFDRSGNLIVVDVENLRIRKIDVASGIISTIAGNGILASTGDGGPATAASLNDPTDICFDSHGNMYISEYYSSRIRKVDTLGVITHFAGVNGIYGYSGDGSRADTARIGGVAALYCDSFNNIYLADNYNSRIFKINSAGIISTVAGTSFGYLFNGDEIPATSANIDPYGLTMDKFGNLFISEYHNFRVRMIDAAGHIHTVAGIGTTGYSGDGGPATSAQFNFPYAATLDSCGNIYIADNGNARLRKVAYSTCNYLHVPLHVTEHFSIYPNPAGENINIIGLKRASNYYRITNCAGTSVMEGILDQKLAQINVYALLPGIYILSLWSDEDYKLYARFIKQ